MTVKLQSAQHLEFLYLKEPAQACLSLHLSDCYIVGNHMSRLKYQLLIQNMIPVHLTATADVF